MNLTPPAIVLAGSYVGAAKFDAYSITSKTRDLLVAKLWGRQSTGQ